MADIYHEFSVDLHKIYEAWNEYYYSTSNQQLEPNPHKSERRPHNLISYEVRRSVCVVGRNRERVQDIKRQVASLQAEPFPIESFHVKRPSDVQDGAFLVPKIILVATHIPGLRLIDERGDEGQLDWLYDQVVDAGADLMVIYIGLPSRIYPSMRHILYHPKLSDNVFPDQPIIQELACDNCLLTITEGAELNKMQKNLLREWLLKPVSENHPIFKTADFLSSLELSMSETHLPHQDFVTVLDETATTNPVFTSSLDDPDSVTMATSEGRSELAKEEHPLADKKKKKRRLKFKFRRTPRRTPVVKETIDKDFESSVEMDMYNRSQLESGTIF